MTTLFEQHEHILRQAVERRGWRYDMPSGGQSAIDAGLVVESDPTWMMSDDYRASNGFNLTDKGRELVQSVGWLCQCTWCGLNTPWGPTPTTGQYCSGCDARIQQYGKRNVEGKTGCGMHYLMEKNRPQSISAKH